MGERESKGHRRVPFFSHPGSIEARDGASQAHQDDKNTVSKYFFWFWARLWFTCICLCTSSPSPCSHVVLENSVMIPVGQLKNERPEGLCDWPGVAQ